MGVGGLWSRGFSEWEWAVSCLRCVSVQGKVLILYGFSGPGPEQVLLEQVAGGNVVRSQGSSYVPLASLTWAVICDPPGLKLEG